MSTAKIRVLIVDDHPMVHIGLGGMLSAQDDIELIGQVTSAEEALLRCQDIQPDIVLMDVLLPGISGVECIRIIKDKYPEIKPVVLSSYDDIETINAAFNAGASGYLLKNVPASNLVAALHDTQEGKRPLSPEVAKALMNASHRTRMPHEDLTERELEVLACVARGMSNIQIGEQLVVSPFTIKAHVSNILSKLGLVSRAEAAAYAVEYKLIKKPFEN